MYKASEMAILMEQMYVDNLRLKERIVSGDTIGKFPQHFIKIHKAVMTDETDKDTFFSEQAAKFIAAQQLIYEDSKNAKEHFNNGIDACIKCHEVKCGGPIPKIKKLYMIFHQNILILQKIIAPDILIKDAPSPAIIKRLLDGI